MRQPPCGGRRVECADCEMWRAASGEWNATACDRASFCLGRVSSERDPCSQRAELCSERGSVFQNAE
eukprot:11195725-Lingulodinium_polyedra.AAC.1